MTDGWHNPVDEYTARLEDARRAEAELEAALGEVRRYAPGFLPQVDLPLLEGLLPDDATAAVSFCLTEAGSVGFVLTRGGPEPGIQAVAVPGFTTRSLNALLFGPDGWVAAARRIGRDRPGWFEVFDRVLGQVGAGLVRPVLEAVPARVRRLILLPAGGLYLLPLHAAPLGEAGERVCDRFVVSYGPSAGVLALLRDRARPPAAATLYAAAVAAPGLAPLPCAEHEARTVAGLFPDATVDAGPAARVAAAAERAAGRAYVHFACHGVYEPAAPPESGLELADGRLRLADLLDGRLDLSAARLVTLSACEAGLTDVAGGGAEEYVGLPAGFLVAGVPCVVGSLWAVDDLAGTMLMERFYRNHLLDGKDIAEALREGQLWLRGLSAAEVLAVAERAYAGTPAGRAGLYQSLRYYRQLAGRDPHARPLAHPHFWAVFTVNGW